MTFSKKVEIQHFVGDHKQRSKCAICWTGKGFLLEELPEPLSSFACCRSRTWLWRLRLLSAAVVWSISTQTSSSGCPTSRHGSAVSKTRLCITHFRRKRPRGPWCHPTSCPIHQSEHISCITAIRPLNTDLFSRSRLCLTDQTCSHQKR